MRKPSLQGTHSKRLERLSAAFEGYRRARPRGRIPPGLRSQALAALAAGVSAGAVREACRLSWAQLARWRQAAECDARGPTLRARTEAQARVFSVVDTAQSGSQELHERGEVGEEIELRIGAWHVSLRRVQG